MATSTMVSNANSLLVDTNKINGHQQENELFLQAFEKPTQIYRFLRSRHATNPIFLNRTLSYMKDRMSRNNKSRSTFKLDSMLETITQKNNSLTNNFLNLVYVGLFDNSCVSEKWWRPNDSVEVLAFLYRITKNKRKETTSDFQVISTFCSQVVYKAHDKDVSHSVLSIPVQSLCPLGDQHTIFKISFRIKVHEKQDDQANGTENHLHNYGKSKTKLFGCELVIVEKSCIPGGEYEVVLQEFTANGIKSFSPKKRTWETLPSNYVPLAAKFDAFNVSPVLTFRLFWSAQQIPPTITAKELVKYCGFTFKTETDDGITGQHKNNLICDKNISNNNTNDIKSLLCTEKIQIVYNFLYGNNTHQQFEYTQELICPWCTLNCLRLYALLKHLKLCHGRFNFTYQPAGDNGARIDVTINDAYDGSYAGSAYDLAGPSGCLFPRSCGPVRRTSVTNLLVCRPRRQKVVCLEEFLVLDEDELMSQRPYITGHNRLYHHTETCLPVHPKELDIDSEAESDPLWLRQKTIQMIDEFSDVNEGEKELMKLWNLHVMKHGYVGDCQLPLACDMFLELNGNEIIQKNLYRNFLLHMCSLFDYGLVSPETVYKTVQKLQSILSKYSEGQKLMSQQRAAQLKYWLQVGIHKQDDQKLLKSPQKSAMTSSKTNANATNAATVAALDNVDATLSGYSSSNNNSTLSSSLLVNKSTPKKTLSLLNKSPIKRLAPAVKSASIVPQTGLGVDKKMTIRKLGGKLNEEKLKNTSKKLLGNMCEQEAGIGYLIKQQTNYESTKKILNKDGNTVNLSRERRSADQPDVKNLLTTKRRSAVDKEHSDIRLESTTTSVKRRLLSRGKMSPVGKRLRHMHAEKNGSGNQKFNYNKQRLSLPTIPTTTATTTTYTITNPKGRPKGGKLLKSKSLDVQPTLSLRPRFSVPANAKLNKRRD